MPQRRGNRALRLALATTGVVLPAATLIPFGSMWLWEHGYLGYWAAGAFVLALSIIGLQWWILRPEPQDEYDPADARPLGPQTESRAWGAVETYAATLTPEMIRGENAMKELALRTIEAVAREMHPGEKNPVWNFTVPEALALAERVAARLRPVVLDTVPLGDQLTVRQVLRLYEWRVAVDWAERAYDIWRIIRLINPAAAITNEARERITKKLYTSLRDEFTVRLAQGYVREVGHAAIELYGGKLRTLPEMNEQNFSPDQTTTVMAQPPSRLGRLARQAKNLGQAGASVLWRRRTGR